MSTKSMSIDNNNKESIDKDKEKAKSYTDKIINKKHNSIFATVFCIQSKTYVYGYSSLNFFQFPILFFGYNISRIHSLFLLYCNYGQ